MSNYISGKPTNADRLHTIAEHLHGTSKVYPTLAAGVDVLSGIAWTLGNFVEIIPANTITSPFDIHWLILENVTDDEVYEMVFYAVEVEIARIRVGVQPGVGNTVVLSPVPVQMEIQLANTQIQAKLASSGAAETATISVAYHTY